MNLKCFLGMMALVCVSMTYVSCDSDKEKMEEHINSVYGQKVGNLYYKVVGSNAQLTGLPQMDADMAKLTTVTVPSQVTIDGQTYTVTSIGPGAFIESPNLTTVSIPNTVTEIEDNAFAFCTSLRNVTLPSGLKTISGALFHECTSLTSITIPDGVTVISHEAFHGSGLTELTIPESVTSIGDKIIRNCHSLRTLKILSKSLTIDQKFFMITVSTKCLV